VTAPPIAVIAARLYLDNRGEQVGFVPVSPTCFRVTPTRYLLLGPDGTITESPIATIPPEPLPTFTSEPLSFAAPIPSTPIKGPHGEGNGVGLIYADTVPIRRIEWLWYRRIAFGKPNALVGLPDVGKDVIACDIAARLSIGDPMPDKDSGPGEPRPTYYLSVEDALDDTLKPRFLAAGGDPRYLATREIVRKNGVDLSVLLDQHLAVIEQDMADMQKKLGCGPGLFVLSPFDAFLSRQVDAWKSADIRRAMSPVARLVERNGWALWAIAHLNKDTKKTGLHRISNSQAFAAALRVAYLVGEDPDDADRRLFVPIKRNLLPPDTKGMTLWHKSVRTPGLSNPTERDTVPLAVWEGDSALSAEDVLAGPEQEHQNKLNAAQEWLTVTLAEGKPLLKQDVLALGKREHFSKRTLERAASQLGIEASRESVTAPAMWSLNGAAVSPKGSPGAVSPSVGETSWRDENATIL
jgi:hypothetical protein